MKTRAKYYLFEQMMKMASKKKKAQQRERYMKMINSHPDNLALNDGNSFEIMTEKQRRDEKRKRREEQKKYKESQIVDKKIDKDTPQDSATDYDWRQNWDD
jgi:hypothetical protein